MGKSRDTPNKDFEPGKSKWLAIFQSLKKKKIWPKETQKECPVKVIQTATRAPLSPWALPCVYPHVLYFFFLLINTLLVSLLSIFAGILLLQSHRARALSLTTGLVPRILCSHHHDPTSITGREPKPCFKPLQAEATQVQCDSESFLLNYKHRPDTQRPHTFGNGLLDKIPKAQATKRKIDNLDLTKI